MPIRPEDAAFPAQTVATAQSTEGDGVSGPAETAPRAILKMPAGVVPAQPMPIEVLYTYTRNASGTTTSWVRFWNDMNDVEQCHRCPRERCQARNDNKPRCLTSVTTHLPEESLATFSLTAWFGINHVPFDPTPGLRPGKGKGTAG